MDKRLHSGILFALAALLVAGCSGQQQPSGPTFTPSASLNSTPATATPTGGALVATLNPSNNGWITYQNKTYGFSFEYPAIYDDPHNKLACGIKDLGSSINLGARIGLDIIQAGSLSLDDFTNQYLSAKKWVLENENIASIGGASAIIVEYHSLSPDQYGTVAVVEHNPVVLVIGFTSGEFCASLGSEGDEASVYQHVLDSFKFSK
jgi:hypothetical protein